MTVDGGPDGAIDVQRATAWLSATIEAGRPPFRFTFVAGGHSCLTYLVESSDGRRLVLRRPPFGEALATAHDVAREHRIISALAPTDVPVPATLGVCRDDDVIGAPFYVMEYVPGVVLHEAADARTIDEAARRHAAETLVDSLVALHAVDPDEVGLGDLAKRTDYVGRQLRRWSSQWAASKTKELPGMDELHHWLEANRPIEGRAGIVHGDYRLGNVIHADDGAVRAILDWELCTLGDPLADLSYMLRSWVQPGEVRSSSAAEPASSVEGFPTRDELIDRYRSASGRSVDDLTYWMAFHAWRSACIVAGVHARLSDGMMGERSDDLSRFERSVEHGVADGLRIAGLTT